MEKNDYEKNLEKQIADTDDPDKKNALQRDRERARRERQDSINQHQAQVASQMKAQEVAGKRMQGGSRINLRWSGAVPPDPLTPEALLKTLSQYLELRMRKQRSKEVSKETKTRGAHPHTVIPSAVCGARKLSSPGSPGAGASLRVGFSCPYFLTSSSAVLGFLLSFCGLCCCCWRVSLPKLWIGLDPLVAHVAHMWIDRK